MGAHDIDLDSEGGWVKFNLYGEQQLDLHGLAKLIARASYQLRDIELSTTGSLVDHGGNGDAGLWLKVDRTGQLLPVRLGKHPRAEGPIRLRGKVPDWSATDPVLEVLEITPSS